LKGALFRKDLQLIENRSFEDVLISFEPMIKSQMKKLRIYKNHDNFFQLGRIGLWEAYKEYDPARGTFQTLAIIKVRGEMLEQLKKERVHDERYTHVELQEFDLHSRYQL